MEYAGSNIPEPETKMKEAIQNFSFTPGDELLYIGYAIILSSMLLTSHAQAYQL